MTGWPRALTAAERRMEAWRIERGLPNQTCTACGRKLPGADLTDIGEPSFECWWFDVDCRAGSDR